MSAEHPNLDILQKQIENGDAEIRRLIAEQLINAEPSDAWPLLWVLACDEDNLVRTEACQTLGIVHHEAALSLLLTRVREDPDELVRAYAAMSLGEIAQFQSEAVKKDIGGELRRLGESQESERVWLALYTALYQIKPEPCDLAALLCGLKSKEYSVRCCALNQLAEVLSEENRAEIMEAVAQLKQVEKSRAVLSTITRLERGLDGVE